MVCVGDNPRLRIIMALAAALAASLSLTSAHAERLKDVSALEGVRANKLLGYGLVVGLAGTGDDINASFSTQSTVTMLRRLGVHANDQRLRLRNVAAVVVTTDLQPFTAPGNRIDVTVSSIGNATSLEGGTLVMAPLKGPDMETYAVAQGPLSVGGYRITGSSGTRFQKNHTTVGRIPNGALVERAVPIDLSREEIVLTLHSPDFTTAERIAKAVRETLDTIAPLPTTSPTGTEEATAGEAVAAVETPTEATPAVEAPPRVLVRDAGVVVIRVPDNFKGRVPALMAAIEGLVIDSDMPTRVVVNERTGTVVLGDGVRLMPVAIAHGGLSLEVREMPMASQPGPLATGRTVVVPTTNVTAREQGGPLREVTASASLKDVVGALNALGVSPRDLVAILQALKASGSLRAELEIQ